MRESKARQKEAQLVPAAPSWSRPDEDPGVAHRNQRVADRDASKEPERPYGSITRHLPRLAQNASTLQEEIDGIVIQTHADLDGASPRRLRSVLVQRLVDAGLHLSDEDVDALVGRMTASAA
ncbi:hypothetical protein ABCS02_11110 [Microbacterium sp. X-17]|uniref:hypothetical protein n=1 Tax=Microbacterium sp. X-17 TaxID=3144404 RepID=UPI0031F5157C